MRIRSQDDLFKDGTEHGPNRHSHGGDLARGKRKARRPFKKNRAHHLVMKSSFAKGERSMLGPRYKLKISNLISKYAKRFHFRIFASQNVGNHIHFMAGAARKEFLQHFLRSVAGAIARLVTGATKSKPTQKKFWDSIVFSRVIKGLRDFKQMLNYIYKNYLEAELGSAARAEQEAAEAASRKARRAREPRRPPARTP